VPDRRLAGTRVLVTRPAHQAEGLARQIESAGGEPVRFPTVDIAEPADPAALQLALAALAQSGLAVFTSPNAVARGMAALRAHGGWPPALRFAAVGAATAAALHAAGVSAILAPTERFDSEALLEQLPAEQVRGKTVLLFRGEGGRELLAASLAARGAHVLHAVCYRRVLPAVADATIPRRLAGGEIDVITATSVDGLHNLLTLAGAPARARLLATPLIVVSERQAQAARGLGFHAAIRVAARADDNAVMDALLSWRRSAKAL
jgi:uroporphyrinogen-III synthase